MSTPPLNASQIGTSIFGMLSGMFGALSTTVITTAVKFTLLMDKSMNVCINLVSAAEHVSDAVDKRANIYGEGMVSNGRLAEREIKLKHMLRLANLEKQEATAPVTAESLKAKADFDPDVVNIANVTPRAVPVG